MLGAFSEGRLAPVSTPPRVLPTDKRQLLRLRFICVLGSVSSAEMQVELALR